MIPFQNQREEELREQIEFLGEQVESLNQQLMESAQLLEECYEELQIANNEITVIERELLNVMKSTPLELHDSKELAKILVQKHLDDIEFIAELREIMSQSLATTSAPALIPMSDLPINCSSQQMTDIFSIGEEIVKSRKMLIEKHQNLIKKHNRLVEKHNCYVNEVETTWNQNDDFRESL